MKTAAWLAIMAALYGVAAQDASGVSSADKALWIDRHNYFRMTALPYSAGNMLRLKWSDELAAQAATDAAACAASGSGAGVNAAVVATAAGSVDAAFQQWVVAPALAAFPTLTAPKAAGEPVGAGVYNSYSQVVWSSTNQVGCAQAACAGGKIGVACRYAPAGNDGTSPWYVHGPTGTACPQGMVSKVGLCVTSADDPSYNDIAPIPAGANAYDVFKDFIPNMQKALKGEAVVAPSTAPAAAGTTAPANTAKPATAGSDAGPSAAAGNSTTTAAPTAPSRTTTPSPSSDATPTPPSDATTPATGDQTAPAPTVTKVVNGQVYVKVLPTSAPPAGTSTGSNAAGATDATDLTPAPTVTKVVDGKVYVKVLPSTGSSSGTSTEPSVGDFTPAPTVTKVVNGVVYVKVEDDDVVGTVKPGSGTGSKFANQASNSPASAASAPTPTEASAIGANNKSSTGENEASFSAAGVAGIIVIGCVAVAGVAVFVSYRKNQKRQRDIMQNGGIHVL